MRAAPANLKPPHKPRRFAFRVSHSVGERLVPAQCVDLALLIAQASASEATSFVDRLLGSTRNFRFEHCSAVTLRSFDDLVRETPFVREKKMLCLEYLSPLHFSPEDSARPGAISSAQWVSIASRRVEALLGQPIPAVDPAPDLEFDSQNWDKAVVSAQSRSSTGTWRTIGNVGPLLLRGAYETIWPLLLLAQEIPLGDAKIGGGVMRLRWHGAAGDRGAGRNL